MLNNQWQENKHEGSDSRETTVDQRQISLPAISLPKGGGAIRGIGEKFAANPVTGTGSMTVPIATSPGRSGFGPQLSLSYDSGAGNGPFGFGWNLSLPSITRKTDKGLPQYLDDAESDVFILSGAEDLVPVLLPDGSRFKDTTTAPGYTIHRYHPRIEGPFARIERWTNVADSRDVHWRSISRDNVLTLYGKDADSRIAEPADPRRIFGWLICETRDDKGNAVIYNYKAEDGIGADLNKTHERNRGDRDDPRRTANRYLKQICYGNRVPLLDHTGQRLRFLTQAQLDNAGWMFEVVFDYGEHDADAPEPDDAGQWTYRDDPFSSYRAGFEVRTTRLCQRVLMFHHIPDISTGEKGYDGLVRSTDFTYSHEQEQDPTNARNPGYTFLHAITQTSYRRQDGGYLKRSLPPVEYEYTQPVVQDTVQEVDAESLENLPIGVDGTAYRWTDLHGEGIPGILTEQAGAWFYKRNLSPISERPVGFAPLERVAAKPNFALAGGQAQFMDLAGDGQLDLVVLDGPMPGLYEHDGDKGWQSFRPLTSRLNRDTRDPNLRFVDLDGNGHADVLISEDDVFVWHASLAEEGFGPARRVHQALDEEKSPRPIFADGTQSIYLADLSGDGLTDLVRIRNGEVCYWPNLGYGRFGAKITMDNAPHFDNPDQFDHKRIRLADIDGSGTADIIYLHHDGVRLYFNQSGNSWSVPQILRVFPRVDDLVSIAATDLLGNGTACLVWSSPLPGDARRPMRYVDLMGGQKPHLLVKTVNNLGAETCVEYAPSTKFYLQDKHDGKPWITRLPFPIYVVEKVTVKDKWRETRFATTYSYHHGYFDGEEREFRGFGRVDQTDIESFGAFAAGNTDSPYVADDQTLYQPPVKTVTWFHTGAFLGREHILSHYDDEYFPNWFEQLIPDEPNVLGTFRENALPEPDIELGELTPDEWRQAMRACKGMMLRQEVYELDVDALERGEERPVKLFSTAHHNCHIRMLQPQAGNPHAVFLVTESEAITYHYELDLRPETLTPDPRIAHTLNLQVDAYGNVLQSVAVVYPRIGRHVNETLPDDTKDLIAQVQRETHLAYTETEYTNDVNEVDSYRLRMPCKVLTYEVTGISPEDESDRRTPDPRDNRYFTLDELRRFRLSLEHQTDGEAVAEIAYHELPSRTTPQKRLVEHVRMLYFHENLRDPLPLGQLNALGLPYETYKLALTDELLASVFGARLTTKVRDDLGEETLSGYLSGADLDLRFPGLDNTGQYWIRSGIAGFSPDAADHFYLPERYTDPFGNVTTLEFDRYDLFPQSSTDPIGNTMTVRQFDYRLLAPREIKDINGNLSEVAFDVLGLPAAVAVKGKGIEGDRLDLPDDSIDPDLAIRSAFFTSDFSAAQARHLLGNTTARHIYYFGEERAADGTISYGVHPPCAAAILREQHVAALEPGQESPLQVAFEYSDGGGNVLVKKIQAEPETPGGPLRWIATGKTILNNKGKPVKQYEPYFTDSHTFAELIEEGVTPVIYYDAVGRVARTELPDGSFSRVEFSPWHLTSYDPNDTVLEPGNDWYAQRTAPTASVEERRAARLAAEHAGTPTTVFLDSLGREVISVAHNRVKDEAGALHDDKYVTFTRLDAEGKPLWIRDARGNLVMQYITPVKPTRAADEPDPTNPENVPADAVPCYDIAGNLLFQHSMDAGDRWMINDAAGQPFYAWDENERVVADGSMVHENRVFHTTYDALRRPLKYHLSIDGGLSWQVVERFEYRDPATGSLTPDMEAATLNLGGQLYRHYDPSGLVTNQRFDFKGNLLQVTRQLASEYDAAVIHWPEDPPPSAFEEGVYTHHTEYDALNRMTRLYNWHRQPEYVAVYEPKYNERGLLVSEKLMVGADATRPDPAGDLPYTAPARVPAIEGITYNAKGQRTCIQYGNDTLARYDYDPETFRLRQLRTTRNGFDPPFPEFHSDRRNDNVLQQLSYTYDPIGNITEIYDEAYEPVFFRNQMVEPRSRYTYDALYWLIEATGRENYQAESAPDQFEEASFTLRFPVTDQALRNYRQVYTYDAVGNIEQMRHVAERGSWTRNYAYAGDSNRLLRTWLGEDELHAVRYGYDTHGSMLNLNRTPDEYRLRWDYRDMIHHVNLGGGGQAWYNYDAGKQRTRKRVERNGSTVEERLYLGGMERYRRWVGGSLVEETETHHLFANDRRVLIVEDVQRTDDTRLAEGVLYRYQYGNHLGSVGLELDTDAAIISYEEYHPYGTMTYRARNAAVRAAAKRYRYTGMERDEETGLNYHTARYYSPWLGRWISSDPIGTASGLNLYGYVSNKPVVLNDPSGQWPPFTSTTTPTPPPPTPPTPPPPATPFGHYFEESVRRLPSTRQVGPRGRPFSPWQWLRMRIPRLGPRLGPRLLFWVFASEFLMSGSCESQVPRCGWEAIPAGFEGDEITSPEVLEEARAPGLPQRPVYAPSAPVEERSGDQPRDVEEIDEPDSGETNPIRAEPLSDVPLEREGNVTWAENITSRKFKRIVNRIGQITQDLMRNPAVRRQLRGLTRQRQGQIIEERLEREIQRDPWLEEVEIEWTTHEGSEQVDWRVEIGDREYGIDLTTRGEFWPHARRPEMDAIVLWD